jgi:hypothetical protein
MELACPACAGYWLPFSSLCDPCLQTCAWPGCGRRLPPIEWALSYPLLTLAQIEPAAACVANVPADERRLCAECLRFRYRRSGRHPLVCSACGNSSCDARFGGLLGTACTSTCDECRRLLDGRDDFEMIECTHRRRLVRAASLEPLVGWTMDPLGSALIRLFHGLARPRH